MSMFDTPKRGAGTVEIHEEVTVKEEVIIHENRPKWERYLAEFLGTLFIVLTAGLTFGRSKQSVLALLGIGGVIGSLAYLIRSLSGAHMNPAVTLSVVLSRLHHINPADAVAYIVVQLVAGICGALIVSQVADKMPKLVADGSGDFAVMWYFHQFIFTWTLCYVFLTVVTSSDFPNQYYGIAVGMSFVPGCGCELNPALALGLEMTQYISGGSPKWDVLGWTVLAEVLGALLAAAAFYGVRHEEYDGTHGHQHRHAAEFLGTFIVVLTVGASVALMPDEAALCIGGAILALTYAFGPVSGAHFNPGVTLGVLATHHTLMPGVEAVYYIVAQIVAGALAGVVLIKLHYFTGGKNPYSPYNPGGGSSPSPSPSPSPPTSTTTKAPARILAAVSETRLMDPFGDQAFQVATAEILFTCLLVLTFLVVITSADAPNQYCGIAMGLTAICVYVAAMPVSGAVLNPAVALGLDIAGSLNGKNFGNCAGYILYELLGVGLAAGLFMLFWHGYLHHEEVDYSDHVTVKEGPLGTSVEEVEMSQRLTGRDDYLSPPYY